MKKNSRNKPAQPTSSIGRYLAGLETNEDNHTQPDDSRPATTKKRTSTSKKKSSQDKQ